MISLLLCFFKRKYQIEFFLICVLRFSNKSAFAALSAGRHLNLRVECTPKSTKMEPIKGASFIYSE